MRYRVTHRTEYKYQEPVSLCHNIARLSPRTVPKQTVERTELDIQPPPAVASPFTDSFGNAAVFFAIQEAHQKLLVTSRHTVDVARAEAIDLAASPPWEDARAASLADVDACAFTFDSPYVRASEELAAYAAPSFPSGRSLLEAARDLTRRIRAEFRYDASATTVATPLEEVLEQRRGVCQDFAHLEIGCLRSLGLAARYVSGYVRTSAPPGSERLIGADASHAWVSVFSPGAGWIDFDPTNDCMPSDQHVVLAWGRDFDDVSPIKGVILGGGAHRVAVSVEVAPA